MIPMLAEHFHGRESVLLFELYKKYRVDISHAHLFGAEKEKKGGTWADEDSDDTRKYGDPESGSESDGNGGRIRVPPPAKQGSSRWKYEKFQEMYGHGLRHDDHHELDSESLHPSQDSVLGPILKKRYGGARATAAAGGGDGSSSSSSSWDEEGEGLSYDERAIMRSQNDMKKNFEAMYGSGEEEEGSEHESESEEEEEEESLYEEDLHDLSDLRSAEPLVVGGTYVVGDEHRRRHHRLVEEEEDVEEEEGSEYESESDYESDSASSGDDPDESTVGRMEAWLGGIPCRRCVVVRSVHSVMS